MVGLERLNIVRQNAALAAVAQVIQIVVVFIDGARLQQHQVRSVLEFRAARLEHVFATRMVIHLAALHDKAI